MRALVGCEYSGRTRQALRDLGLVGLIAEAKSVGVPQGLIVATLHGHAHNETQIMIDRAPAVGE